MKPITLSAVEYIALHMREADKAEVYGMRAHDSPFILAKEVILAATYGKAGIAEHNGVPVAVVGVSPSWPGVWDAWAFGTDDWHRCAVSITRYALNVLRPHILERGAHRMHCASRIDHTDAHRWLSVLGAKPESVLRNYGRDGSDYVMFAWSR